MRWLCMNLFRMHLLVDQAATASSESLALSICFTPDTHGILSGILCEPLWAMPRPRHHSGWQICREEEQVGQRAQS